MKVVKINKNYYGVIEDTDNLDRLICYFVTIHSVTDFDTVRNIEEQVRIESIDEMNRIQCSKNYVLLPEIDNFEIIFTVIPTILSEARFKFLCEESKINYKEVVGISYDISYVLDMDNYNNIKREVDEIYGN